MLSNYHPSGVLGRLFSRSSSKTAGQLPPLRSYGRTHQDGRRLPPYYLPGFSTPPESPDTDQASRAPQAASRATEKPETYPGPQGDEGGAPLAPVSPEPSETKEEKDSPAQIEKPLIKPAPEPKESPRPRAEETVYCPPAEVEKILEAVEEASGQSAARLGQIRLTQLPEEILGVQGEILAGQAGQVLAHLRRGEWQASGAYRASLFVISHELWLDGAGDLVGRASELARILERQGLVEVQDDGITCLALTPKGRSLADQMLSPLAEGIPREAS